MAKRTGDAVKQMFSAHEALGASFVVPAPLFVCPMLYEIPHLGSWRQNAKRRCSQKLSNLQLSVHPSAFFVSVDDLYESCMSFKKTLLDSYNPRWRISAILKIDITSFFFCWGRSDLENKFAHWHRITCRLRWYGQTRNQMYNSNMAVVWANSMACHPTATCHIAGCCHLVNSLSW